MTGVVSRTWYAVKLAPSAFYVAKGRSYGQVVYSGNPNRVKFWDDPRDAERFIKEHRQELAVPGLHTPQIEHFTF